VGVEKEGRGGKGGGGRSLFSRMMTPDYACISFYKIFGHPAGLGYASSPIFPFLFSPPSIYNTGA
jgi:hypothetical protein